VLAASFGAFDALATLAAGYGGAAAFAFFGAALVLVALGRSFAGDWRVSVLPLLMCIDNLVFPQGPLDAICDALTSTSFAVLGFVVSSLVVRCLPVALRAGRDHQVSPWA
jgi:hypothetical protein